MSAQLMSQEDRLTEDRAFDGDWGQECRRMAADECGLGINAVVAAPKAH